MREVLKGGSSVVPSIYGTRAASVSRRALLGGFVEAALDPWSMKAGRFQRRLASPIPGG